MPIAIYARKSTESEDRQVQSLDDQISALTRLAERENLRVAEVFQESKSAKAPGSRPEFERLRKKIEKGQITGVLTWSMNRLSRNPVDGGIIAYLLQTGRLEFIRTTERIYRPEDNALLLSIENGMATAYLQDLSRNVKRGMRGKVERGWHPCKAPVGYLNDPETREVVIDPQRSPLVRRAFKLVMQGQLSGKSLHRQLVLAGLTVRRRKKESRPISYARLYTMLRDPFYTGKVRYKGEIHQGRHEPLISDTEFELVQRRLGQRIPDPDSGKKQFLLGDFFRCAACGCRVIGEEKQKRLASGRYKSYIYYHCSAWKGCRRTGIREEELISKVWAANQNIRIKQSVAENIGKSLCAVFEKEVRHESDVIAGLQEKQSQLERRVNRLTEMRLDGELTAEEYAGHRDRLVQEQAEVREELTRGRSKTRRILDAINQRIDAAIRAGELSGRKDHPLNIAQAATLLGSSQIDFKAKEILLDPIIQKIASIEPALRWSESRKQGNALTLNSVWWALAAQLRTVTNLLDQQNRCIDYYEQFKSKSFRQTNFYKHFGGEEMVQGLMEKAPKPTNWR